MTFIKAKVLVASVWLLALGMIHQCAFAFVAFGFVGIDDPNVPAGYVAHEVYWDGGGAVDWTSAALRIDLAAGSFYQDPYGGDAAVNPLFYDYVPSVEFDTYVGIPNDGTSGIAGGAGDLGGGLLSMDAPQLSVSWFNTDSNNTGYERIGMISLSDDAVGTGSLLINGHTLDFTIDNGVIPVIPPTPEPEYSETISWSNKGWFTEDGEHIAGNYNTLTGSTGQFARPSTDRLYRSFHTFDIPQLDGPVTHAILRVELEQYESSEASETATFWEVTTDASDVGLTHLVDSQAGIAIYDDLGDGQIYATETFYPDQEDTLISIELNSEAIEAITNAQGGQFVIGASIPLTSADGKQFIKFSEGFGDAPADLLLITVPEPTALLSMVCCGFALLHRRD